MTFQDWSSNSNNLAADHFQTITYIKTGISLHGKYVTYLISPWKQGLRVS